ncbi:MAG TPA: NCS2 family permease, partial [Emticicia sp.]
ATAPALLVVGVLMIKPITKINWDKLDDAVPAFLAMVLIPFTYSITQGIIWGFLSWTIIKIATNQSKEVSWMLIVIDIFALWALYLGH